jgi:ferritin-like metal-binding protein YciE
MDLGNQGDYVRIQAMPRQLPPQRSGALPDHLMQQLRLIHASEAALARDLKVLFRRTNWLPLRLVLADQRRETNRHVDRLASLMPMATDHSPPAYSWADESGDGERTGPCPPGAIIAGPLRASRAAVTAYATAIAAATERGLAFAAQLLSSSLAEEMTTTRRLASMAAELGTQ